MVPIFQFPAIPSRAPRLTDRTFHTSWFFENPMIISIVKTFLFLKIVTFQNTDFVIPWGRENSAHHKISHRTRRLWKISRKVIISTSVCRFPKYSPYNEPTQILDCSVDVGIRKGWLRGSQNAPMKSPEVHSSHRNRDIRVSPPCERYRIHMSRFVITFAKQGIYTEAGPIDFFLFSRPTSPAPDPALN